MKENKKIITMIIIILMLIVWGSLELISSIEKTKSEPYEIKTGEPLILTTTETTTTSTIIPTTAKITKKVIKTTKKVNRSEQQRTARTYKLTHYGPDCKGCSGITASGYNVRNTIWYNDPQYGEVRIVATSSQFKMYSIIKIKDYKLGGDITAIVLDRGVGNGVIDLLVGSEKAATQLGIQKVEIEVLRKGK